MGNHSHDESGDLDRLLDRDAEREPVRFTTAGSSARRAVLAEVDAVLRAGLVGLAELGETAVDTVRRLARDPWPVATELGISEWAIRQWCARYLARAAIARPCPYGCAGFVTVDDRCHTCAPIGGDK